MSFTAREEYGLQAVICLGSRYGSGPVQSREVARAEKIPEQFLEQVLAALRRAGIVKSIRGASGGYELARSPSEITAGDVIRALGGLMAAPQLAEGNADEAKKSDRSVVANLQQRVQAAMSQVLDGATIQDMLEEKARQEQQGSFMMYI